MTEIQAIQELMKRKRDAYLRERAQLELMLEEARLKAKQAREAKGKAKPKPAKAKPKPAQRAPSKPIPVPTIDPEFRPSLETWLAAEAWRPCHGH